MADLICAVCAAQLANTATPIVINRPDHTSIASRHIPELLAAAEEPGVRFTAADGMVLGVVVVTQYDGTLICSEHAAWMIQQLTSRGQSRARYSDW